MISVPLLKVDWRESMGKSWPSVVKNENMWELFELQASFKACLVNSSVVSVM